MKITLANFLKLLVGAFILIILIFSFLIIKNYQQGYGCVDCIVERTLSGKDYDGWSQYTKKCENFNNDKDSALSCLTKFTTSWKTNVSIDESQIKVPSLKIFNTVITSKNLPAYVFQGEGCRPSFAVDIEGNIYSVGGCLG